jgi:hypothetical protein
MAAAIGSTFLIDPSVTLIPAPAVSNNIGVPVILTDDTLSGGGAGSYVAFSTAAAVATALAASEIGATTAANLNAALGQEGQQHAKSARDPIGDQRDDEGLQGLQQAQPAQGGKAEGDGGQRHGQFTHHAIRLLLRRERM